MEGSIQVFFYAEFHSKLLSLSTAVGFYSALSQVLQLEEAGSSAEVVHLSVASNAELPEARTSLCQRADELYDLISLHLSPSSDSLPPKCTHVQCGSQIRIGVEGTKYRFCFCGRFVPLVYTEHTCKCDHILRDPTVPKIETAGVSDLEDGDRGESDSDL
ncbi:uncharacterized protein LOC117169323 [Belonocnema kinseyi]|uniref:uncharacterized protein LOC117169323 n=1 Tax=Belonocnema kinseyi TaxID=2817044 RepID=UPI00143E0A97|nr:uncharacterized protein LOC117169323 [Belonocnema kinseyi]XP_033211541.1 uncharacterized protein LOC117169323 [Belonocnema kinseyi]XP_033211542.1 uncharacterized protein LOC117169323 [Belonocnema kinseyi]